MIRVDYRPIERRKELAGGVGRTEILIPQKKIDRVRKKALNLLNRVETIHPQGTNKVNGIEKEAIMLYRDVAIVVPTVDNYFQVPSDKYLDYGWPGLSLQSENYILLKKVAKFLGNLPVPSERKCRKEKS